MEEPKNLKVKFKKTAAMLSYHNARPEFPNFEDGEAKAVTQFVGGNLLETYPDNFTLVKHPRKTAEEIEAEKKAAAEAEEKRKAEEAAKAAKAGSNKQQTNADNKDGGGTGK